MFSASLKYKSGKKGNMIYPLKHWFCKRSIKNNEVLTHRQN